MSKNEDKIFGYTLWKSIYNSFCLLLEYSKSYLCLSLLYKLLNGFLPIVYIVIMQRVINMVQSQEMGFSVILTYILCFVGIHVGGEIIENLYSNYNYRFKMQFSKRISMKVMQKSMELSLSDFEDSDTYNIINRAQSQSGGDVLDYILSVFDIIQEMISIGGTGYILVRFRWQIVMVVMIVSVIRSIITYHIDKVFYQVRVQRTTLEREKWYIHLLLMTGNAFKEIKILGLGSFLLNKYENIQNRIISQETRMYGKRIFLDTCFNIIDWMITGAIYIYTIFTGFSGKIHIGDVTAYIDCTDRIKSSVISIFSGINSLVEQAMYIDLLFQYFAIPVVKNCNKKKVGKIQCIEFRNVSFRYRNGMLALKDINFFINEGESIAIIGENGSGKSTLVKLLLGLYNDYEGEILVNNVELKSLEIEEYQKRIGTVFQDFVKYETSLRENIGYGDLNRLDDDDEIYRLLKAVGLDEKVMNEDGIDTIIGNWFGGQQLSGGEWQRLAIARALIKKADVYIFDEPDAALDIFKQREIVGLFNKTLNQKIGFYVSHKINFVNELADRIVFLQNGKIVEMGTHEELILQHKWYYQLYMESRWKND